MVFVNAQTRSADRVLSASRLTNGAATKRTSSGQVARSNIQAAMSSHRSASKPFNVQRKNAPPVFSTTEWTKTSRPVHG
jgi:hypothetical protein